MVQLRSSTVLTKGAVDRALPIVSLALFFALWQFVAMFALRSGTNVPGPAEVFRAGVHSALPSLWPDLTSSLMRLVPGLLLGSLLGVGVGVITGRSTVLMLTVGPILHGWRALPAVALAPIFLQLLGINEVAKISVIAIGVFFPVWVATHEGVSRLSPDLLSLAQVLELSRWIVYWKIVLPWTLPFAVAGIRIGIASGYTMLFFSEWLGATYGLGYRASVANTTGRLDLMLFCLAELGALAYLSDLAFTRAVDTHVPWMRHVRS